MASPQRLLGLDALRAGAVLAVMASHVPIVVPQAAEIEPFLGLLGLTGVCAFFALSGFLVGGIALCDARRPGWIRRFWLRRWLRTIPAALVVAGVFALVVRPAPSELLLTITFSRWLLWDFGGSFLPHYWSLAVEEWAYLLLPALVIVAGQRRDAALWLGGVWLVLIAAREVALGYFGFSPAAGLYATVFRLDAILGGVVVAAASARWVRRPSIGLACAAAVGIAAIHVVQPAEGSSIALLWGPVMPALFALTLPALAQWRPSGSGIVWRVAGRVAALSYGLYLVHLPVFALVPQLVGVSAVPAVMLAFLISWGLAEALRRYVELPFIALRDRLVPRMMVLDR